MFYVFWWQNILNSPLQTDLSLTIISSPNLYMCVGLISLPVCRTRHFSIFSSISQGLLHLYICQGHFIILQHLFGFLFFLIIFNHQTDSCNWLLPLAHPLYRLQISVPASNPAALHYNHLTRVWTVHRHAMATWSHTYNSCSILWIIYGCPHLVNSCQRQ